MPSVSLQPVPFRCPLPHPQPRGSVSAFWILLHLLPPPSCFSIFCSSISSEHLSEFVFLLPPPLPAESLLSPLLTWLLWWLPALLQTLAGLLRLPPEPCPPCANPCLPCRGEQVPRMQAGWLGFLQGDRGNGGAAGSRPTRRCPPCPFRPGGSPVPGRGYHAPWGRRWAGKLGGAQWVSGLTGWSQVHPQRHSFLGRGPRLPESFEAPAHGSCGWAAVVPNPDFVRETRVCSGRGLRPSPSGS